MANNLVLHSAAKGLCAGPGAAGQTDTEQLDSEISELCDQAVEWKISYQTVSATEGFCVCVCALN